MAGQRHQSRLTRTFKLSKDEDLERKFRVAPQGVRRRIVGKWCQRFRQKVLEGREDLQPDRPRHTHRQWLGFLKHLEEQNPAELTLRLIIDKYGTHKTPKVKTWVKWRNARQRKEQGRDRLIPRSAESNQTCKEAGDWMAVLGW